MIHHLAQFTTPFLQSLLDPFQVSFQLSTLTWLYIESVIVQLHVKVFLDENEDTKSTTLPTQFH